MTGDGLTALDVWRHLALAENIRARRNWQGLENDKPVKLRDITPGVKVNPKAKLEETPRTKALRMRIQQLHLEGLAPSTIAAQLDIAEAVVWKDMRGLYHERWNKLSDAYRQLRVDRVFALKKQGLELPEIAELMGFTTVLLNKDMREIPQDQLRAAAVAAQEGKNTGRMQDG